MRYFTLPVIVIIGLVAYRLARVLAHDKIGEPVRKWAYKQAAEHGRAGRWVNALITCPFCLSVWFAIAACSWYAWMVAPTWPGWGEFLLAIAASAGIGSFLSSADLAMTVYVEGNE